MGRSDDTGMKYMDGELYRLIMDFKDLGGFDTTREAQRSLAKAVKQQPLELLLSTEEEKVGVEYESPYKNGLNL